jgi:hypothetical protein
MSIASDCSDSSSATLINMTDLNMTAIEHVAALTNDNSNSKNNDLINVQRRAAEVSTGWVPLSFNEIPITSNTLNITINNNSEILPNITAIPTNTRTIAPKPVSTATTMSIPVRQDNNTSNVSGDGTQAVIITSSDSVVNPPTTAKSYGKVIPISSQLALVTSADGQVIAVPISQLVSKGNVNLKTSGTVLTVPVGSSASNIKSKTPIITPLKVLPLIASTTTSSSVTVPTISHSKNVQTVLAPASMSFATAKAITSATAGGVTIIPTSVSSFSSLNSTETTPQFTATSTATITALPLETKSSIVSNGN